MGAIRGSLLLYQPRVILNRLLYPLRLNTNIPLSSGGGTVLQQSLNKGNIKAVILVNLRSIPLTEAVGADILTSQMVANDSQLFLNSSFRNREDSVCAPNALAQAVIFNVLLNDKRYSEDPVLASFLLHDLQMIAISVPDYIAKTQPQYIADAQTQICFQHQSGSYAVIRAAATKALLHCLNDFLILLLGQCFCFLIHSYLQ